MPPLPWGANLLSGRVACWGWMVKLIASATGVPELGECDSTPVGSAVGTIDGRQAGIGQRRWRQKGRLSSCSARSGPNWKPHPRAVYFSSVKMRLRPAPQAPCRIGEPRRGEPSMRKPRGYDLDTARREAPGPWRIGGEDDAGIHVVDANGERVATIWKTPSRLIPAVEAIQALVVRMGDEALAPRLCANPECRRPFDAPSRTQKHCSAACAMAIPSRMSSRPASAMRARLNCGCRGSLGERSPSAVATPIASGPRYAQRSTRAVTG